MPTVSVIIATYNRCEDLKRVLEGLRAQKVEGKLTYEVIVVDNNSTDATRQAVESYMPKFSSPETKNGCLGLRYFFEARQGKSYALNRGIQEARGDILAFTDDDVLVDPYWLYHLMECFKKYGCAGVGGRVLPVFPEGAPQWVKDNPHKAAGAVVICDHGEQTQKYEKSMELFIGANYAFRQEAFTRCGTFRTDLKFGGLAIGEDREFIRRLIKADNVLYYCGQALVWHPVNLNRLGFKHMIRWHTAAGRCAARSESEEQDKKSTSYFGIPRYLYKTAVQDFLFLVLNLFNRLMFWKYFRGFFRTMGMMAEYRMIYRRSHMDA